MLFHPDSPFVSNVPHLFPQSSIGYLGVLSKGMCLYDLSLVKLKNIERSLERIGKYLMEITPCVLDSDLLPLFESHYANPKRVHVGCDIWQKHFRATSQSLDHLSLLGVSESTTQQLPTFTETFPRLKSLLFDRSLSLHVLCGLQQWFKFCKLSVIL